MIPFDFGLLQTLTSSSWVAVYAMPVQGRRTVLFDIVFTTDEAGVRVIARDWALASGDELYYLDIHEFAPGGYWKELGIGVSNEWMPRDIKAELVSAGFAAILTPPRLCRVFTNPELFKPDPKAPFPCVAIEFSNSIGHSSERLTLVASQHFPCTIDCAIEDKECNELLSGLIEVHPGTLGFQGAR